MLEQINDILQNTVITPYTATVKLLISFLLGAVIGICLLYTSDAADD